MRYEDNEEVEVVIYPLYMYLLGVVEGPPSVGEPLKSSGGAFVPYGIIEKYEVNDEEAEA